MKNRKRVCALLLALTIVAAAFGIMFAAPASDGTIKLTVDSQQVVFPDAQPYLDSAHRTMVPIRFVTEAMGADVKWDSDTSTAVISKNGITVNITKGSKTLTVNSASGTSYVTMDTVAVVKDGRTFVPIRFVVEALGGFVDYSNYYGVAEIASCSGELNATEMKRLRSYAPVQWWANYFDSDESKSYIDPTIAEIYGANKSKSWFADAHQFLVTQDDITWEAKDIVRNMKADKGTHSWDYAKFIAEYVEQWVECETFEASGVSATGHWNGKTAKKNMTVSYKTDAAMTYQAIGPAMSYIDVRGVMTVTPHSGTDSALFEKWFDVTPEMEKTYTFDTDFVISVDKYGYLDIIQSNRFDVNGNAVDMIQK